MIAGQLVKNFYEKTAFKVLFTKRFYCDLCHCKMYSSVKVSNVLKSLGKCLGYSKLSENVKNSLTQKKHPKLSSFAEFSEN